MNDNYKANNMSTRLYFLRKKLGLYRALEKKLRSKYTPSTLHGDSSKHTYDKYGDRELHNYEKKICLALKGGCLTKMPYAEVRDAYIEPIAKTISEMLGGTKKTIRILEVGCGNGTNLKILKERFGDNVELNGIDISAARIETGKKYWGDKLDGIELKEASATDLSIYKDGVFDLVYSICALEQITYRLHEAVNEMVRLSNAKIVCVEPTYELGNSVQRLYNVVNDQCRTLLPELKSTGLKVYEHGLMPVLHNPLCPVGLLIADKNI